jgi:hypothetical protein
MGRGLNARKESEHIHLLPGSFYRSAICSNKEVITREEEEEEEEEDGVQSGLGEIQRTWRPE